MCVIFLFLSLCLSVIVYLCFSLTVSLCGSLILYLSLCLSACLPPFISHFLSPSVSEPLFFHLIPQSLSLLLSLPLPPHSLSPGGPLASFGPLPSPFQGGGGELGRHRGGAATGRRSRTGGWGRQVRACGSQGPRKGNQGSSDDPPLPLPTSQSARNPRVL